MVVFLWGRRLLRRLSGVMRKRLDEEGWGWGDLSEQGRCSCVRVFTVKAAVFTT